MKVGYEIGDCLEVLSNQPECSFDSCVTDPPYGLAFMGKHWDKVEVYPFTLEWGKAVHRVLKPGAWLLSFGGTRTYHRMTCALEDAGFEIRDCMMWLYGSGFPKSYDISKGIDKKMGAKRGVVGEVTTPWRTDNIGKGVALQSSVQEDFTNHGEDGYRTTQITAPATPEAQKWQGWGTALKPAWEPIVVCRKPLIGTVVDNVLKHGTGGINVDGCRIAVEGESIGKGWVDSTRNGSFTEAEGWNRPWKSDLEDYASRKNANIDRANSMGRWPSNVLLDEDSAKLVDEQSGELTSGTLNSGVYQGRGKMRRVAYGEFAGRIVEREIEGNSGGASRFFYTAKASKEEREQGLIHKVPCAKCGDLHSRTHFDDKGRVVECVRNIHPTVKPKDLLQYLIRLVTPTGGICLDPFVGSGTTLLACRAEAVAGLGIEKNAEYEPIIKCRLEYIPPALETFEGVEAESTVAEGSE